MSGLPTHLPRRRRSLSCPTIILTLWLLFLLTAVAPLLISTPAYAAPTMMLPTPPGEAWKIIQGYGCGTHNAWDRFSLDLASVDGSTYGAPVRAVADGTIWVHDGSSGTLILDHGDNFYTMYTHMQRLMATRAGTFFAQGSKIGEVGDVGTRGNPHLHFTAFTASSYSMGSWRSQPLSFSNGPALPELGGCNQHFGRVLTAGSLPAPEISFSAPIEPQRWYNADARIEFTTRYATDGLGQGWDMEPPADAPMFARASAGYANVADKGEGMHTLWVRAFARDGRQTMASFGPVGYDITPPDPLKPISITVVLSATMNTLSWPASHDALSGLAGYRIYLGPLLNGEAERFVDRAELSVKDLSPGRYFLRAQPLDQAGNSGKWATVATVEVWE